MTNNVIALITIASAIVVLVGLGFVRDYFLSEDEDESRDIETDKINNLNKGDSKSKKAKNDFSGVLNSDIESKSTFAHS